MTVARVNVRISLEWEEHSTSGRMLSRETQENTRREEGVSLNHEDRVTDRRR